MTFIVISGDEVNRKKLEERSDVSKEKEKKSKAAGLQIGRILRGLFRKAILARGAMKGELSERGGGGGLRLKTGQMKLGGIAKKYIVEYIFGQTKGRTEGR